MAIAIIYETKYGATHKIAQKLAEQLKDAQLFNLAKVDPPSLSDYDKLIIGGAIYAGAIRPKVKKFLRENKEEIIKKKYALFLGCLSEGSDVQVLVDRIFPKDLQDNAVMITSLGGEIIFSKLSFIENFITKKIHKTTKDIHKIDHKAITALAKKMS